MASRSGSRATEALGNSDDVEDDDTGDIGYDLEDLDNSPEVRSQSFSNDSNTSRLNRALQDDV